MKKIIFSFVTVGFLSLFCIVGSAGATTETYTVKPGDSLWKVSINHNLTVDQLKKMNNLTSDTIYVGQQLTISNSTSNQPKYNIIFQAGKKVKIPILAAPSPIPENKPDMNPSNPLPSSSEEILLAVVEKSIPLLDTPYRWGGITTDGFDCSGFIYYVFKMAGLQISRTDTIGLYKESFYVDEPKVGDLVFFENTYRSGVSHAGIYIGNGEFIHAASKKVEISSIDTAYWEDKFLGFKRFYSLH